MFQFVSKIFYFLLEAFAYPIIVHYLVIIRASGAGIDKLITAVYCAIISGFR